MYHDYESLNSNDKERLRDVIREFRRHTCILRTKHDFESDIVSDNPSYTFCDRADIYDILSTFFEMESIELKHDREEGVFYITGEGLNVERMDALTTYILIILKVIYSEIMNGDILEEMLTSWQKIRDHGDEIGLFAGEKKYTERQWKCAFRTLQRHNVIRVNGNVEEMNDTTLIYIYPTINLFYQNQKIMDILDRFTGGGEDAEIREETIRETDTTGGYIYEADTTEETKPAVREEAIKPAEEQKNAEEPEDAEEPVEINEPATNYTFVQIPAQKEFLVQKDVPAVPVQEETEHSMKADENDREPTVA